MRRSFYHALEAFALFASAKFVLVIPSTARAVEWFDSFGDGNIVDGTPVTWTYNEIGRTPGLYEPRPFGLLTLSNPGGGSGDMLIASVDADFQDAFVRAEASVLPDANDPKANFGGSVGVVARWDPFAFTGYGFVLDVDGDDFLIWQSEYEGQRLAGRNAGVPEPASVILLAVGRAGLHLFNLTVGDESAVTTARANSTRNFGRSRANRARKRFATSRTYSS